MSVVLSPPEFYVPGTHDERIQDILQVLATTTNAEACGLFVVAQDSFEDLILDASYSERWHNEYASDRTEIQHNIEEKGGIIGRAAMKKETVSLETERLQLVARHVRHLQKEGRYQSCVATPIVDEYSRLWGVLKCDNKRDDAGNYTEGFTADDVDKVESCARELAQGLANREMLKLLSAFRSDNSMVESKPDLFQLLANYARLIARGQSATFYVEQDDRLIKTSRSSILASGDREVSITKKYSQVVAEAQRSRNAQVDPDRKALAAPIVVGKHSQGVMLVNAPESEIINWSFQAREVAAISTLCRSIGSTIELLDMVDTAGSQVHHDSESQTFTVAKKLHVSRSKRVVEAVVLAVKELFGFESVAVFRPVLEPRLMVLDTGDSSLAHLKTLSTSLDEDTLTTEVFCRQRPVDTSDPTERICEGVALGQGRAIGLPLVRRNGVVGTLVAWCSHNRYPVEDTAVEVLQPFAELVAEVLDCPDTGVNYSMILQNVERFIRGSIGQPSLKRDIRLVLLAIMAVGFDRVRALRLDKNRLNVLDLVGMEGGKDYSRVSLSLDEDHYARHLFDNVKAGSVARLVDPNTHELGPDPMRSAFDKPTDLPWAAVPLVVRGNVYGKIACDNAIHRHPISKDALRCLSSLGSSASLIIANSQTADQLREAMRATASNVGHCLRNSINVADYWLHDLGHSSNPRPEAIKNARDEVIRAQQVIKMLENWGRHQHDLPTESYDVRHLLQQLKATCQRYLGMRRDRPRYEVGISVEPGLPRVPVNLPRLVCDFENFVADSHRHCSGFLSTHIMACRASREELARAGLDLNAEHIKLTYTDSGPGIPLEFKRDAFLEFESTSDGLGIGLSLANETAQALSGTLYENGLLGVRFQFLIPAEQAVDA